MYDILGGLPIHIMAPKANIYCNYCTRLTILFFQLYPFLHETMLIWILNHTDMILLSGICLPISLICGLGLGTGTGLGGTIYDPG